MCTQCLLPSSQHIPAVLPPHLSQELLAISADRVDLLDLRTKNPAPTSRTGATAGLQLLPTPDGAMLLELRHGPEGWQLTILSLDEAADPPLFRIIKESCPLPAVGHLPQVTYTELLIL